MHLKRLFLVLAVVDHKRINNNKNKRNHPERHATDKTKTFILGSKKAADTAELTERKEN